MTTTTLTGNELVDTTTVAVGGTGNVGYFLVEGLLRAGAHVLVPTRSEERFDHLRSRLAPSLADRVAPLLGDIGTADGASTIERMLPAGRTLSAVVSAAASWHQTDSMLGAGFDDFKSIIETRLYPHYLAAQTFIPHLEQGGAYISINGPVALLDPPPPGTGAIAVSSAAHNKLAHVIASEVEGLVRVNDVVMWAFLGPDGTRPGSGLTGEQVGDYIAALASPAGRHVHGQTLQLQHPQQVTAALLGRF